jgi:L-threonylcarbamoyladenylate synthase
MLREQVNKALEVLQKGGIILYPSDTIWGIGCDATNKDAVEKIIALKKRKDHKGFIVLLDSDSKLQSYVNEIPAIAYDLIEYAENPLTIVYSGAKNLAKNVIGNDGSIGIRIVKHDFCTQLLQRFRKPIVSTSANFSGEDSPKNFHSINPEIYDLVDYIVDFEQENQEQKPVSTIMKLEADGTFKFIRK